MTHLEYFKLQAKNLFKDYKTKIPYFDEVISDYLYEYNPQYFDIEDIIMSYDVDEENFSLMKAQHIIALIAGFDKWSDILKASEDELELAKLLFINQEIIDAEEWKMYIFGVENDNNITFDPEMRLKLFKYVFLNEKI